MQNRDTTLLRVWEPRSTADCGPHAPLRPAVFAPRMAAPISAGSPVASFTFGPGPLGIAVQEVRGGTRIAIESVASDSQAEALGVPVGGLLMSINGRIAKGMRLAQVGKMLASAGRPCTLHILIAGGPTASEAGGPAVLAAVATDDGTQADPPPTRAELLDAGRRLTPYIFNPGPLGLTLKEEAGAVVVNTVAEGSASHEQGLAPEGILVALNGADLLGLTKPEVGRMLGRAPRPMTLLIATPPPPPPTIVTYSFGRGPLGITLADALADATGSGGGVAITDVARGSAAEKQGVMLGSAVVAINASQVEGLSKLVVGKMLARASRPLQLQVALPTQAGGATVAAITAPGKENGEPTDVEKVKDDDKERWLATEERNKRNVLAEQRRPEVRRRTSRRHVRGNGEGAVGIVVARKAEELEAANKAEQRAIERAEAAALAEVAKLPAEALAAVTNTNGATGIAGGREPSGGTSRVTDRTAMRRCGSRSTAAASRSTGRIGRVEGGKRSHQGKRSHRDHRHGSPESGSSSSSTASDTSGAPLATGGAPPGVGIQGSAEHEASASVQKPRSGSRSPPTDRTLNVLAKPRTARRAKTKKNRPAAHTTAATDHGRELTTSGYQIEGPIASGAFSTVLRARVRASGIQVAIKSFDEAKCKKSKYLAYARDCELSVLRGLRHYAACIHNRSNGIPLPPPLVFERGVVQPTDAAIPLASRPGTLHGEPGAALAAAATGVKIDDSYGKDVAVRDTSDPNEVLRELQKGGHAHIANMVDELVGPAATHAILEYCAGGSLDYYLTSLRKKKKMSASFSYDSEAGMCENEVRRAAARTASTPALLTSTLCP